jgi:large subunit ribosomal protein L31
MLASLRFGNTGESDPRSGVEGQEPVKAKIHPNYVEAKVVCACGNTFQTRSTRPSLHTEVCSKCHPFFTGEHRIVDTAGRVERFKRRYGMK